MATSSGTYNFQLTNGSIVMEAFDRIQIRPIAVDPHMLLSARISMNLELIDWENAGLEYWKIISGTIPLVVNQATYTLPANLVTLEELYYTSVNANGSGVNLDRFMTPIQRTQYAQITNKLQQGIPTMYFLQMTIPQQVTIWQIPAPGQAAPNFVLSYYGLQQMQDVANVGGTETPDIPLRAIDALCAKLAVRLCEKFGPTDPNAKAAMMREKAELAMSAWTNLQRRDQEPGPISLRPRIGIYGRI